MKFQRLCLCKEIVETEERYVEKLQNLHKTYGTGIMKIMSSSKDPLAEGPRTMFANLQILTSFHVMFLRRLQECLALEDEAMVGAIMAVFIKEADFLKMYHSFVEHYSTGMTNLHQLAKSNRKLDELTNPDKTNLAFLLIQPITRLPRYVLFMEALTKNMPRDHPVRKDLITVTAKIQLIAQATNDAEGLQERLTELVRLADKIDFELLQPNRRLIKHAPLTTLTFGFRVKKSRREVYVFNDMLMWTTLPPENSYVDHLLLAGATVKVCACVYRGQVHKKALLVSHNGKEVRLLFKKSKPMQTWLTDLSNVITDGEAELEALAKRGATRVDTGLAGKRRSLSLFSKGTNLLKQAFDV